MLIDGKWCDAVAGGTIDVVDPATGKVISNIPQGAAADVDLAVAAARRTFDAGIWASIAAEDRAKVLWRYADLIEDNADELATIEVLDNGMPLFMAQGSLAVCSNVLRYMAGSATRIMGQNASGAISSPERQVHAYTAMQPVGVAGMILPWNVPAATLMIKLAPALAVGCSVVVKPAENTSLATLRLGELALEAGVPAGVLNIVTGYGKDAGDALVRHPGVDKITFTGSTQIGKDIVRIAANDLKRVTLELGGKSPCIIFEDADIEAAIPAAAMAIFVNSGQICFAGSRLFVHKKVYDKVMQGIVDFASQLKIGNGFEAGTMIGPLISDQQRSRVGAYVQSGLSEGAELLHGGNALDGPGFFQEPTVFANIDRNMKIVREEIFGPVLVATPFDSTEQVIAAANDTRYGLGAGLFTMNIDTAIKVADAIQAGNVWVNGYGLTHSSMPFGGMKESGWGRENSDQGLAAFLEPKSVFITLGQ